MIVELLRHTADRYCSILSDGRVSVDDLIAYLAEVLFVDVSLGDVYACMKFNNKGRLQLWYDSELGHVRFIRAVGGHSIKGLDHSSILLPIKAGEIPGVIFHGTKSSRLRRILS